MRPMTLSERGVAEPTVSLRELLAVRQPSLQGSTGIALDRYAEEICRSGFPGFRTLADRALRAQLDGYLTASSIATSKSKSAGRYGRPPRSVGG